MPRDPLDLLMMSGQAMQQGGQDMRSNFNNVLQNATSVMGMPGMPLNPGTIAAQQGAQPIGSNMSDFINQLLQQHDPFTASVLARKAMAGQGQQPPGGNPGAPMAPPSGPPAQQAWQGVPYRLPEPPQPMPGIGGTNPNTGTIDPGDDGFSGGWSSSPQAQRMTQQPQAQAPNSGFITRGPESYNNQVSGPGYESPRLPSSMTWREFESVKPLIDQSISQRGQTQRARAGNDDRIALENAKQKNRLEVIVKNHETRMQQLDKKLASMEEIARESNNKDALLAVLRARVALATGISNNVARIDAAGVQAYDSATADKVADDFLRAQTNEESTLLKSVQEAEDLLKGGVQGGQQPSTTGGKPQATSTGSAVKFPVAVRNGKGEYRKIVNAQQLAQYAQQGYVIDPNYKL